jgi:hypothetical protein
LIPQLAAVRVCELGGTDARAAVLLESGGGLAGSSDEDGERSGQLAELARELLETVDAAVDGAPPEQVEAQVEGGSVYVVRRPPWTLAVVARRGALSSLMFYDLRTILSELDESAG